MPKVICASLDCKYNGKGYQCTAKKITMSEHYMLTVNEGRQHLWRCKQYEKSEEVEQFEEQFKRWIENDRRKTQTGEC